MRITQVRITNFLGLSEFKIAQTGKVNRLSGGNGVGKTAVLKALHAALKGRGIDPRVIRIGADKSEIFVEIDSRVNVTRTITQSGAPVKVTDGDIPKAKPQAYLDELLGQYLFNPVDFILADASERKRQLLAALPFQIDAEVLSQRIGELAALINFETYDFSKHGLTVLEAIKGEIYDSRREVNRDKQQVAKAIAQEREELPETVDEARFAGFDMQAVVGRISESRRIAAAQDNDVARLESLRERATELAEEQERLQKQLAKVTETLADVRDQGKELKQQIDDAKPPEDITQLQQDVVDYEQHREHASTLKRIAEREQELDGLTTKHAALDRLHKLLAGELQTQLLAEAELPIPNLTVEGETILVGGVSLDTLSTSEQIDFALQAARLLAGKLKVICLDRFETLDPDKQARFRAGAADDDFEYFVTEVTTGDLQFDAEGELNET